MTLYGKPLLYLIGASEKGMRSLTTSPGRIVEGPYRYRKRSPFEIAYCNLFDQTGTDKYGPYLAPTDTATQYGERRPDPRGPGWKLLLDAQFSFAKGAGFQYIELDNPDGYSIRDVMRALEWAQRWDFRVIAKNPLLTGDPGAFIRHQTVAGAIVERGAGTPRDMEFLRQNLDKPLPVWFVFDGPAGAALAAKGASAYKGMGVTFSDGEGEHGYNGCHTLLTPSV